MKILIKAYTAFNLGDDLFIYLLCKRYSNHQFYLSADNKYINIFNINNLIINVCNKEDRLGNDIIFAQKYDIVVYIGGSIFMEHKKNISNKYRYLHKLIEVNNNFYIIGANFGPYETQEYFDYVKNNVLKCSKGVCFRDKYSYDLFKNLDNISYAPDVVFGLDFKNNNKLKQIGISVIHHLDRDNILPYYEKYINKLKEVIYYFSDNGYKINLFGFCSAEKDDISIEYLISKLDKQYINNIKVYNYKGNINGYLNILSKQEYLVATRFHSLILGLKFNIKVLPICYSDKTTNVIKDINLNIPYYPISKIELLKVEDILNLEIKNIDYLVDKSYEQFKYLDKILL